MTKWLRRARAVVGLGFIWALGGAAAGGLPELADNIVPGGLPAVHVVDMWPQTLAIAGFIGGMIFAVVLGVAGSRRRFDELSLPGFAGLGAVAGVLLGALGMAIGGPIIFMGLTTILGAIGGASSLALARMTERRELLAAGAEVDDVGLTDAEKRELLGRG